MVIREQISDCMEEVRSVLDELEEGSIEWNLMSAVHSQLATAGELVFEVNRLRLAELLSQEVKSA